MEMLEEMLLEMLVWMRVDGGDAGGGVNANGGVPPKLPNTKCPMKILIYSRYMYF